MEFKYNFSVALQDLYHVLISLGLVNVDSFLMMCSILNQWVYLLSCFECEAFCLGSWNGLELASVSKN